MSKKTSLQNTMQNFSYELDDEIDDIFSVGSTSSSSVSEHAHDEDQQYKTKQIFYLPSNLLVEYEDEDFEKLTGRPQPFRVYSSSEMEAFADSIAEHGILVPLLVRPWNDQYQIISGRHRNRAAKMKNIEQVPCIIEEMDDVRAAKVMLHTNLQQRHNLSYGERAWGYRMDLELESNQGYRSDLETLSQTECTQCTKLDALGEIAKRNNVSRRTVAYIIRLTYLIPELLEYVDQKRLPYKAGAYTSYLSRACQHFIYQYIKDGGKIKLEQAHQIYNLAPAKEGPRRPSLDSMMAVLAPSTTASSTVSINRQLKLLKKEIPEGYDIVELFKEFLSNKFEGR